MWGRLKTYVLVFVVAAAALVPLCGDPRQTPVTHPLWARVLLRSLDMTDAVRASSQASQVFAALAARDSLMYPADRFLSAEGAQLSGGVCGSSQQADDGQEPHDQAFHDRASSYEQVSIFHDVRLLGLVQALFQCRVA